jgi:KaiC/GvpD/RAD55 family RecA-like ATPase
MDFSFDSLDNQLVTTGITGLDVQLGGGIPVGTTLLLIAESGAGAEIFTKQFLYGGLNSGESAFYFSSDRSIAEVKADMSHFGWDVSKYEETNKIEFIDAYTPRFVNILPPELRSKMSAKEFLKAGFDPFNQLKTTVSQNRESRYRGVIDSISYFLRAYDLNSVIEVIELMSSIGKLTGGIHLIVIGAGLHDDITLNTVKYLTDGMIEFYVKEKGSQIERGLLIRKMRGMIVPNKSISFDITRNGIELETTTRVL